MKQANAWVENFIQINRYEFSIPRFPAHFQSLLLRACLHGGGGPPRRGSVTGGGAPHLSGERDKIKTKDYMDRKVTSPKWVTSTTWRPPPPCKQALRQKPTHSTAHTGTLEQFPKFHEMRGLPKSQFSGLVIPTVILNMTRFPKMFQQQAL